MGFDVYCFCIVYSSWSVVGKIVFMYFCYLSFLLLYRWEKGVEVFFFICIIYGGIFCDGDFVSIFDVVLLFD